MVTYAELVEVVLVFAVVKVPEVVLVDALLEVEVVEVLIVDVDSVVPVELAVVDVAPLAVAVAGGRDPDGAP
jgi:hypothetical protein